MSKITETFWLHQLVFAKMKGFPYWPGKVSISENFVSQLVCFLMKFKLKYFCYSQILGIHGNLYEILFFGTYDAHFVEGKCMKPYNADTRKQFFTKKNMTKKKYKLAVNDVMSQYGDSDADNNPDEETTIKEYDQENNKSIFRRKFEAAPIKILKTRKTSLKNSEKRRVAAKIEKSQARLVVFPMTRTTRNMKKLAGQKSAKDLICKLHLLLRNVGRIQGYLVADYDKVDLQTSIVLLNEIICDALPDISKLMLLKYPKSVKNLLSMRKYVGNLESWNLDEEEKVKFNEGAATIRSMATSIGNHIMVSSEIFIIPKIKN